MSDIDDDDDVDLTNLIDPMVLLCGLLMLLIPAMSELRVHHSNLADSNGSALPEQRSELPAVLIEFDRDGNLFQDDAPCTLAELPDRLADIESDRPIYLAGDRDAPYGLSLQIKSALQDSGHPIHELTDTSNNPNP